MDKEEREGLNAEIYRKEEEISQEEVEEALKRVGETGQTSARVIRKGVLGIIDLQKLIAVVRGAAAVVVIDKDQLEKITAVEEGIVPTKENSNQDKEITQNSRGERNSQNQSNLGNSSTTGTDKKPNNQQKPEKKEHKKGIFSIFRKKKEEKEEEKEKGQEPIPYTREEIEKALRESIKQEEEKSLIARVTRKYRTSLVPLVLAMVAFGVGSLHSERTDNQMVKHKIIPTVQVREDSYTTTREVPTEKDTENLRYAVGTTTTREELHSFEGEGTPERIIDPEAQTFRMKGKAKLSDDREQDFFDNAYYGGPHKNWDKFAEEEKYPGEYQISGFAIVVRNGEGKKVIEYIQDFNGTIPEKSENFKNLTNTATLMECIQETLKAHNCGIEDIVEIKVHFGINPDITRLGWLDITQVLKSESITMDVVREQVTEHATETGKIEDFQGDTVTLKDGTIIPVKDKEGHFLPSGTIIEIDGREYTIEFLQTESDTKDTTRSVTVEETREVKTTGIEKIETIEETHERGPLTWKVTEWSFIAAAAPLIFNLATALDHAVKNAQSERNPHLEEFANERQYERFLEEFKRSKEEYEEESRFGRILKRIFIGRKEDILRRLTKEQAQELYSAIKEHAGKDFQLGPYDRIKIESGKIVIYHSNNQIEDITEKVMSDIASIGRNNPVEATGDLGEEYVPRR